MQSFDTVGICFDSDDAGTKGAKGVAKPLTPNKAKTMTVPEG